MSKRFDAEVFAGGYDGESFVADAKTYSKEDTIRMMLREMDYLSIGGEWYYDYRIPTVEDVHETYIRYYPKCPEWCGCDGENGCYSYGTGHGSFPVWEIKIERLRRIEED